MQPNTSTNLPQSQVNSNMQWQNSQPIHPDKVRAALGNVTLLHSFLLPKGQPQQSQTPQEPQGEAKTQETAKPEKNVEEVKAEMELEMNKKLDEIRKEMRDEQKREMDNVKELITSALAEEDKNEPAKTA